MRRSASPTERRLLLIKASTRIKGDTMNKEWNKLSTNEKLDAIMDELINIRDVG